MKIRIFLATLLLSGLSACSGMIANLAASTPVPNYVHLHSAPRVGDYALYRSSDGLQLMRLEVVAVDSHGARVRASWPQAGGPAGEFLRDLAYHFDMTLQGRVLRAELLNTGSGRVQFVRVAGPGEIGYIDRPELRPLTAGETLAVGNARYAVDAVLVYTDNREIASGPARITSANFMSDAVPFGLVKQVNVLEAEVTAVQVAQFVLQHSGADDLVIRLLDWILEKSERQRAEAGMDLVSYGYGA